MNKLIAILILVSLLMLAALPAAASRPAPRYYHVDVDGACWLPDAKGTPDFVSDVATSFRYEKPNILVITCDGELSDNATLPRETTKLDFNTTGRLCAGKLKDNTRLTQDYGAVVSPGSGIVDPSGRSEITCRFDLSATDP